MLQKNRYNPGRARPEPNRDLVNLFLQEETFFLSQKPDGHGLSYSSWDRFERFKNFPLSTAADPPLPTPPLSWGVTSPDHFFSFAWKPSEWCLPICWPSQLQFLRMEVGPFPLKLLQADNKHGADSALVQLWDRHLLGACAGGVIHNSEVKQQSGYYPEEALWNLTSPASCCREEQSDTAEVTWPEGAPWFCGGPGGYDLSWLNRDRVKSCLVLQSWELLFHQHHDFSLLLSLTSLWCHVLLGCLRCHFTSSLRAPDLGFL